MRPNQRKHLYPIIWVLIFGLANAGGQPENTENFKISSEMDLNGEIKLNRTDVELDEISTNSIASEAVIDDDWYADDYEYASQDMSSEILDIIPEKEYDDFNLTEPSGSNSKTTKRIESIAEKAFRPRGPLPPDQTYTSEAKFEKAVEEFEVSTIVTLALGVTILFIAGTIGAGYCSSRRPSRSETRSSRGLSLPEPGPEGEIDENQPLVDAVFGDDPVQNQNNAGAIQQV